MSGEKHREGGKVTEKKIGIRDKEEDKEEEMGEGSLMLARSL